MPYPAWIETLCPASASLSSGVAWSSKTYAYAYTLAAQTSDLLPEEVDSIAGIDLANSNATTGPLRTSYGRYIESHNQADAKTLAAQGLEIASINHNPVCSQSNPYNTSPLGLTESLRLGAGKPGESGQKVSVALTFANIENKPSSWYDKGIVFGLGSIAPDAKGIPRAINFAQSQAITWWSPSGACSYIRADGADPARA
jgi:hypothetical protein